jgi:hypothetical protein
MSTKIKRRPVGGSVPGASEQPPRAHDVANLQVADNPAARRARVAPPSTVPAAAHARHHVGLHQQA